MGNNHDRQEKIIFLDIDGVLTSVRTGWMNMDIYAVNFLRWICEEAKMKIVISSTWRHNHGYEFWKGIFGEYLHEDFKTPDLKRLYTFSEATRGSEIQAWLDKHKVSDYLIIDDDADMLEAQKPQLIQTDSLNGMLDSHMMEIREKLKIKATPKDFWDEEFYQHNNMFAFHNMKKEKKLTPIQSTG